MKLIIINGSPASGKSTLAEKLHQDLPMSLLADIDAWRRLISGWRDNREQSLTNTYKFTVAAVDAYLKMGHSVVVDKAILSDLHTIDELIESGKKHDAEIYEFILTADKEIIVDRANKRGFHENRLLTPERVVELWQAAEKLTGERMHAVKIDTSNLTPDDVYQKVRNIVFS